jgi:TM2 domain-containing membrane protein YozV/DNA-directed RNA polymerase subunit RPC12/RpoP
MYCRNCGKEFIELSGRPEICAHCGARALASTSFCLQCGSPTNANAVVCVRCGASLEPITSTAITDKVQDKPSRKSRLIVVLLSLFLGWLGIHRFYSGKIVTGIIMLLLTIVGGLTVAIGIAELTLIPLGIVTIWNLNDLFKAVFGRLKDGQGKRITRWGT